MAEGATSKLDTDFKDHGTLRPPGPFGRVVRLGFGVLTLLPVVSLVPQARTLLGLSGMPTHFTWWLAVGLGLWVFPYVINIGFTVSWHGWPRTVALIVLATSVAIGFMVTGATWSPIAGGLFLVWIVYTFGHLSLSFLLSAAIATPGCEMRAIPHLWTVLTGRATKEHYCPGALDAIDRWEARRAKEQSG